jgi:hypothetical protein
METLYGDHVPEDATTHAMWVETKAMVADCLTKKMKSEQMEVLRCEGTLAFDMNKENSKKAMAKACSMGNRNEMSISGLKKPWMWKLNI